MAKIRVIPWIGPEDPPYRTGLRHVGIPDLDGPGLPWHCIWCYSSSDHVPIEMNFQWEDDPATGLLRARAWASMPLVMYAFCSYCRGYLSYLALPRFNTHIGPPKPQCSYDWDGIRHDNPVVACFAQPWWNYAPPGFAECWSG
jgi:hypothetical protein